MSAPRQMTEEDQLDFCPARGSNSASVARRIMAQGRHETLTTLRNGEQLLVSLVLPLLALVGLVVTDLLAQADGTSSVNMAMPGILALAVLSSGLTGQGIATGFDRRYGVLTFLSTTPLGPLGLMMGKVLAVLMVLAVQLVVIGGAGFSMGWLPVGGGIVSALLFIVVGAGTFTGIGLLIAGTFRPEGTLAVTNLLWVLLGAAGGVVFPAPADGVIGTVLSFLPSAALGDGLRMAMVKGQIDFVALLVLAVWGLLAMFGTVRWFKWK